MTRPGNRGVSALLSFVAPFAMLIAWFWFYRRFHLDSSYAVSPVKVVETLFSDAGTLVANALLSVKRLLLGTLAGALIGTCTGLILARHRISRLILAPTLQALVAVPFLVYLPFLLLAFQFGEVFRVSVVAVAVFLLVNAQVFQVLQTLNPRYIEIARIYEKTPMQLAMRVLFPAALPAIVGAVRLGLLFGWLAVAISERAAAQLPDTGLGYYFLRAKEQGHYPELFASAIAIALVALLLDAVVGAVYHRVSRWTESSLVAEREAAFW